MSEMNDKDFLINTCYLVCGKKVLEYLEQHKKIVLDEEMTSKFLVGLLISKDAKLNFKDHIFSKIMWSDSFVIGYKLRRYIDKKTAFLNDIENDNCSDRTLYVAYHLWLKNNLVLPESKAFLTPFHSISCYSYLSCQNEMDRFISEMKNMKSEEYEKCNVVNKECICGKIAEKFYKKRIKWKFRCFFNKKLRINRKRKNDVKWSADAVKMQYYESCWLDTIRKITSTYLERAKYEKFFNGLRKEIEDINKRSSDMCTKRNKEQSRIITFSILATIFNALATGLTSISEYELEKEVGSELWKSIINAAPLITLAISTSFTALFTGFNYFKEHNAYEEAWLRHQLNRSRLTGELEKFCEGLGEYSCINKNDNKEEIRKAIRTFQKNIYLLRKQDDANFFSNMNCINFDKEDYKFDDNDEDNNTKTLTSPINQPDEKVDKSNQSPADTTQNIPNEPVQSSGDENAEKNSNNPDSIEDNSDVPTEVKEKSSDKNSN